MLVDGGLVLLARWEDSFLFMGARLAACVLFEHLVYMMHIETSQCFAWTPPAAVRGAVIGQRAEYSEHRQHNQEAVRLLLDEEFKV
jgi:hypothetical protein